MSDPIIVPLPISRDFIRAHPNWTFLFGDNLRWRGSAGQAYYCRGFSNCIGIPTKKLPCNSYPEAFFHDNEFEVLIQYEIDEAIGRAKFHASCHHNVIIPFPHIGEGLARLKDFAPLTLKYIQEQIKLIATPDVEYR